MYTYGHHDFFQEPGIMLCTQEVEKNSITIEDQTYGHHDFFQEPGIMLCTTRFTLIASFLVLRSSTKTLACDLRL